MAPLGVPGSVLVQPKECLNLLSAFASPLENHGFGRGGYKDAEYVDGTIEERPRDEFDHNAWQQPIQLWFWQQAKA